MYVCTNASNAALSPARARATRAPSRSAAAMRSGDCSRAAGALALTESETLGRVVGSAQRRAACGIPDLSAPSHAGRRILQLLQLVFRHFLGALASILLELDRPILLLLAQHRHR